MSRADTASVTAPGETPTTGLADRVDPKASRVIWLLLAAAFVAILNETTMGVAIPHLIGDLGITAVQAQWLTTAFMLTMAVVIPTTGFLLRRFTTRTMFAAAMGLYAAWTLIEGDVVRDRTLTSYPSLTTDLRNAGATWVDEEVVVDRGFVTSRTPDDLPAFNAKL